VNTQPKNRTLNANARIPLTFISSDPSELGKPYRDKAGIDPLTHKKSWFEGVFNQAYDRGFTRSTALEAAQIAVNKPADLRAYEKARGYRIATTQAKGSTPDFEKVVTAFRRAKKNHPEEAEEYKVSGEEGERLEAESRTANRRIRERIREQRRPLNKLADFVARNKGLLIAAGGLFIFARWINKSPTPKTMVSVGDVERAKEVLKSYLGHPSWLRGIGIGGKSGDYCVQVNVERLTDDVRAAIPSTIDGVPVLVQAVGQIRPL
jgi:hypothetical protein